jgi:hypothetical protein
MLKSRVDARLRKRRVAKVAALVAGGRAAEASKLAVEWGLAAGGEGVAQVAGGSDYDYSTPVTKIPQKEPLTPNSSQSATACEPALTQEVPPVFEPCAKSPDLPELASVSGNTGDSPCITSCPVSTDSLRFNATSPGVGARQARVYAKPLNPLLRLIEFVDDRSHGKLRVGLRDGPMLGWRVFVVPDGRDWKLHGKYNARGTRVR